MNTIIRFFRNGSILLFLFSAHNHAHDSVDVPTLQQEIQSLKEILGEYGNYELSVQEFNLKQLLERMIERCPSPSSTLTTCGKKLEEGHLTLTLSELLDIMPELVIFTSEHYLQADEASRALRPDAPSANAHDAVSGCNGGCDLTQVLALLRMIKRASIYSANKLII